MPTVTTTQPARHSSAIARIRADTYYMGLRYHNDKARAVQVTIVTRVHGATCDVTTQLKELF